MKAVTFVEIDVDRCTLTYGVSPCTAAIPTTGNRKCYNTRATCQDLPNYDPAPSTIRFAVASDYLSEIDQGSLPAIPSVVAVDHTPAVIRLGEDLGERASVRITFLDHPDSDLTQDPYISERPNPAGTFWGRFRARHRFILGRPLRWIEGKVGQSISEMDTRHYIIEAIDGPDVSGRVTIVAKDVLKLADGSRAQVPRLSRGVLSATITDTDASITLSPAGIGNLEYDGVELIAINDEILRVTARSGDTLTVTRGQEFTEASAHEEDDTVQAVRVYTNQRASVIVRDLLVNDAGVDPTLIDLTRWNSDYDDFINRVYSARIAEPTPVRQLISELMEQVGFSLYVDELANAIKFVPLRALATPVGTLSDDVLVADSLSYRDQPEKRVSQVWVYYGQRNPLEKLDEPKNFSVARLDVDLGAESAQEYGQSAIRTLYSRWITRGTPDNAEAAASLIIERFRNPPQKFQFALQRCPNLDCPDASQSVLLRSRVLQDDTGAQVSVPVTIISRADNWRGYTFEGEEFRIQPLDPDAPDVITLAELGDTATANINLRDVYFPGSRAIPPTDDTKITFVVPGTTIIGGVVAGPTISTGDWPAGADVTLQVNGQVLGRGGRGGDGGFDGTAGEAGSTAILATRAISIVNNGTIAGGGGGGGGGGGALDFSVFSSASGGGGGGGAGKNVGAGGFGGPLGFTPGQNGSDGTNTAGGAGGAGGSDIGVQGGTGGAGGNLGQAGAAGGPGIGDAVDTGGAGGAAGAAIEGSSFVTLTGSGTIIGAQV